MIPMQYYHDSKLSIAALGLFFVLVLGYAGFEARGVIVGPKVTITSQSATVHDPLVSIVGHADRISSLTMNNTVVSVTQEGGFDQQYLLSPGENTITFEGKDAYGRITDQQISYTYQPLAIVSTTTNITTALATSSTSSSPVAVRISSSSTATTTVTRVP